MPNTRLRIVAVFGIVGGTLAGFSAGTLLEALYNGLRWVTADELQRKGLRYESYPGATNPAAIFAFFTLGLVLGVLAGGLVMRAIGSIALKWDRMATGDKVTLFLGIFAGIVGSFPFLFLLTALGNFLAPIAIICLTVGFSALAIYALRSMDEVLPWQRSTKGARRSGLKILDTNVIIDGRIYDVARTGFLEGQIYVPKFVLEELQHIADSSDALRRQRGRRGLDVLRLLQAEFNLEVGTQDRFAGDATIEVDSRLVKLASALGGDLVTNDSNLNRVAKLQQVTVLNLNDLALSLKPNVLPSEGLMLHIVREGNQVGQGVGYLDDGTMVVVEGGKRRVGETLSVLVTQVIQTERGKMIFAEVPEPEDPETTDASLARRRFGSRRTETP